MPRYRKRPIEVEATQWFRNGDHPNDNATEMFDYPDSPAPDAAVLQRPQVIREGAVVKRFRRPYNDVGPACQHCGKRMRDHGWVNTLEGGHIVCPGDWIITGVKGEFYPCKPDIFEATYEQVEEPRP
jgi:hypothetical protein